MCMYSSTMSLVHVSTLSTEEEQDKLQIMGDRHHSESSERLA